MARGATLSIKIVSDARGAAAGFAEAESRVDRFQSGLGRASVAAGGVLAGLGALATGAFNAASDLQQSAGAVESVFGASAEAIKATSEQAAQAVGLSSSAYQNMASIIGSQLTNMGLSMDESVGKTQDLIAMGADLSATFGGSTQEAVEALSSALRGERDPIERYGISLSQASIDAQVAASGMDTSTDAAKRLAQAQATMTLITQQGSAAQGAFGREADTAAGQQQRLTATWENAQAQLGEALLPVVSDLAEKLAGVVGWMAENQGTVQAFAIVIGGLALAVLAVNAGLAIYQAVTTVVTAVQWLFNTALLANPLTWIVLLIVAVVAAVIIMYNKFDWFREFIQGAFMVVTFPMRTMFDILGWIWDKVGGLSGIFTAAFNVIKGAIDIVTNPIRWLLDRLEDISDMAGAVGNVIGSVVGFFTAPEAPAVGGGGGPAAAGLYGAAPGTYRAAPMGVGSSGGGVGGSAGSLVTQTVNVNVEMTGAVLDPVAAGRQLVAILRDYGVANGSQVALAMS